jgi:hypothetical protein
MPTIQEKIINKALEILETKPEGMHYSELHLAIQASLPEVAKNTIDGTLWRLDKVSTDVIKPERGLFILNKYLTPEKQSEALKKKLSAETFAKENKRASVPDETKFYQPFADYLVNDLEECTGALPLGGSKFGDKWGTPDVLGVYKFSEADPLRPATEIISAEIKTDISQLITAFGQACAYKLFSHKVYLVIPNDASGADVSRVESLCLRFYIGLILFDKNNPENPAFEIRTRASKNEPDYFYVNNYLLKLGDLLRGIL